MMGENTPVARGVERGGLRKEQHFTGINNKKMAIIESKKLISSCFYPREEHHNMSLKLTKRTEKPSQSSDFVTFLLGFSGSPPPV